MRALGIIIVLFAAVLQARSQDYPRWFLDQEAVPCARTAVGYSPLWFHKDSSAVQAARNAHTNLARQHESVVQLGQAFWTTEIGNAWMGGDFKISTDSLSCLNVESDTNAAAVAYRSDFAIALCAGSECTAPDSLKEVVRMPDDEPDWVLAVPQSRSRFYSVGVAPRYFYEMSSWEAAERMALIGLAKAGGDSLAAIEKSSPGSGQEVLNEHVSVTIRDYEVVARWCDETNGVFYVLTSVEKDNVQSEPVRTATH